MEILTLRRRMSHQKSFQVIFSIGNRNREKKLECLFCRTQLIVILGLLYNFAAGFSHVLDATSTRAVASTNTDDDSCELQEGNQGK